MAVLPFGRTSDKYVGTYLISSAGAEHWIQDVSNNLSDARALRVFIKKAPTRRLVGAFFINMADRTGLEPATSGVTGRHSNQLNYRSVECNTFKTLSHMVGGTGIEPVTYAL